ncbi:WYL domain-containing protein, partial [bacterium]|nr:WYL domain-containing protein [bacterium]
MPRKLDPDRNPGEKAMSLFAKLLFSRKLHSISELADSLRCSKQTVLRYIADIERMPEVRIVSEMRGTRRFVGIANRQVPRPSEWVTEEEIALLWMCRSFTRNVLGHSQFEDATRALERSVLALDDENAKPTSPHFSSLRAGAIDYEPHREVLSTLIRAMDDRKVCEVSYLRAGGEEPKTFHVKPLKIFTHRDTLYLHGERAKSPGKPFQAPKYEPILAIHRFRKAAMTDVSFQPPKNYDFSRSFDKHFGLMNRKRFQAAVEFTGWAAHFVAERTWSSGQKVSWKGEKLRLEFSATSEEELVSWVLSFG